MDDAAGRPGTGKPGTGAIRQAPSNEFHGAGRLFVNGTVVCHPMHVHPAHMQVLDRQPFDYMRFIHTGEIELVGPPQPPAPNEVHAPKDTVRVDLGTITRVALKFDLPSGTTVTSGRRLRYVHHCHMLEHEDDDMMRPFDLVVP